MLIEHINIQNINNDIVINKKLFEDSRARIRLSSIGRDILEQYLSIKQPIPPDERLRLIFANGHLVEQLLLDCLSEHIYNRDGIVHTGIIDDSINKEITGEIDCLYKCPITDTEYVVDVKTMSEASFKKLSDKLDLKATHPAIYAQLQMYMHFLHIHQSFILAYNKNNSNLLEVICEYNKEDAELYVSKIHKLIHHLKNGTLPELEFKPIIALKSIKSKNKEIYTLTGDFSVQPHQMNLYSAYMDTAIHNFYNERLKGLYFDKRVEFEDLELEQKDIINHILDIHKLQMENRE